MKSARELFKKLGYKLDEQEDYLIYWKFAKKQRVNYYHTQNEIQIEFNFTYKTIEKRELLHTDEDSAIITLRELQAINQQVNELGWNDTTVKFDVKLDGKKVIEAMRGENNA